MRREPVEQLHRRLADLTGRPHGRQSVLQSRERGERFATRRAGRSGHRVAAAATPRRVTQASRASPAAERDQRRHPVALDRTNQQRLQPAPSRTQRVEAGCGRGAAPAVGSELAQPTPGSHTSTHACASLARITCRPSGRRSAGCGPGGEPGDHAGRDAGRPQQHRLGGGEVLAEAPVGLEQEVVDRVDVRRGDRGAQLVLLMAAQVVLDGGDRRGPGRLVVDQLVAEVDDPLRQVPRQLQPQPRIRFGPRDVAGRHGRGDIGLDDGGDVVAEPVLVRWLHREATPGLAVDLAVGLHGDHASRRDHRRACRSRRRPAAARSPRPCGADAWACRRRQPSAGTDTVPEPSEAPWLSDKAAQTPSA